MNDPAPGGGRARSGGVGTAAVVPARGTRREAHTLLSRERAYRILVREVPGPRAEGTEVWRWFRRHRLRNALSRWYFARSVEMPATPWQRHRVAAVRAAPDEVPEQES